MEQTPNTPNQTPIQPQTEKASAGPIVGAIIVIIVLALGALYFWGAQLNQTPDQLPLIQDDSSANVQQDVSNEAWIPPSSNSDDAAAIEAELQATDMSGFEQNMSADANAVSAGI